MNIIATLYSVLSLNPVGPPSIVAAIVVIVLLLLTQRWIVGLPAIVRRVSIIMAPWVCLGCFYVPLFLQRGWAFSLKGSPAADWGAAMMIYHVFGFAFGLEHFRFLRKPYRAHGSVMSFIHGTLLVAVATRWMFWLIHFRRYASYRSVIQQWNTSDMVDVAVPVFWVLWLVTVILLNRHVKLKLLREQGCCVHCAYDLRGNVSGVCPECGNAVDPVVQKRVETI